MPLPEGRGWGSPPPACFWLEHLPGSGGIRVTGNPSGCLETLPGQGGAGRCGRRTLYVPIINPLALTVYGGLFVYLRQNWRVGWCGDEAAKAVSYTLHIPKHWYRLISRSTHVLLNESPTFVICYTKIREPRKGGKLLNHPKGTPKCYP